MRKELALLDVTVALFCAIELNPLDSKKEVISKISNLRRGDKKGCVRCTFLWEGFVVGYAVANPGHWESFLREKTAICKRVLSVSFSKMLCTWFFTV